ncbi:hypothetical protein CEXT_632991 [Caerostris extrusa]|uniref:Uncharacterized protein n=1 Tax=Caerostris extrusa TaxID=172846 RepID=A0AAV4N0H0_CAEEX|nr:hypothetical protein CEXT_632991 [Caerostris extrusa]
MSQQNISREKHGYKWAKVKLEDKVSYTRFFVLSPFLTCAINKRDIMESHSRGVSCVCVRQQRGVSVTEEQVGWCIQLRAWTCLRQVDNRAGKATEHCRNLGI